MGSKDTSTVKLRGKQIDESDEVTVNVDALAAASEDVGPDPGKFNPIPDEMTPSKLFNGIPYSKLPVVTVQVIINGEWGLSMRDPLPFSPPIRYF